MNKHIADNDYSDMRLRGLKLAVVDKISNIQYVEAEFLCSSELGLFNLCKFLEYVSKSKKIQFLKLHISGDKHTKYGKLDFLSMNEH